MTVVKAKKKNYKSCLEATELENKINYLEKNKIDIYSIKQNYNKLIKNNKSILKIQQSFKIESPKVFT